MAMCSVVIVGYMYYACVGVVIFHTTIIYVIIHVHILAL